MSIEQKLRDRADIAAAIAPALPDQVREDFTVTWLKVLAEAGESPLSAFGAGWVCAMDLIGFVNQEADDLKVAVIAATLSGGVLADMIRDQEQKRAAR